MTVTVVPVAVMVVMGMIMIVMVMPMVVIVTVTVMVMMMRAVLVVVDALMRAAAARVLAEQQRLDGDRHGVGRHADTAEIDVIEIAQHDAVDRQNLALDQKLLAQDRTQGLRDIAVEHEIDRLAPLDRACEAVANAARKGGEPLV